MIDIIHRNSFYTHEISGNPFGYFDEFTLYYSNTMMSGMAFQITCVSIVYSTVCSGAHQRKHQSAASLAFVRGIDR